MLLCHWHTVHRTIPITGETRGIGRAYALQFATDSFNVVLGYSNGYKTAAAPTRSPHECVDYAAAKAEGYSFTRGLTVEITARSIRVVGVAPGTATTRTHAEASNPIRPERVTRQDPMGRGGTPEDSRIGDMCDVPCNQLHIAHDAACRLILAFRSRYLHHLAGITLPVTGSSGRIQ